MSKERTPQLGEIVHYVSGMKWYDKLEPPCLPAIVNSASGYYPDLSVFTGESINPVLSESSVFNERDISDYDHESPSWHFKEDCKRVE